MIWYRSVLAQGYERAPIMGVPWEPDDDMPDPLRFIWSADNGDFIMRAGQGRFQLAYGMNDGNWYFEIGCRMVSWPGGDAKAVMSCQDGVERTMVIPAEGTVVVDDVKYTRTVRDAPLLPPEEDMPFEEEPDDEEPAQ